MMRVIFRGEEKRRLARMEKEATLIHRETMDHFDEVEEEVDPDEELLEELLRTEEEELMALLAAREQAENETLEMEDVVMSDCEIGD
jgi:tRNA U34 5-carboxymethylaminomethyl modifying enzyme MnmG/GidA